MDPGLTKIKGELFNLRRILGLIDRAGSESRYNSERVLIELVARLIRVQQQRIRELVARVEFLERDALQADREHASRRQELTTLRDHHTDLQQRYDVIMGRTR